MRSRFHDLWSLRSLPGQVTVVGGASTGCRARLHPARLRRGDSPRRGCRLHRAAVGRRRLSRARGRVLVPGHSGPHPDADPADRGRGGQSEEGRVPTGTGGTAISRQTRCSWRSAGLRTSSHWTSECRASSLAGHTSMSTKRCARMCRTSSSPATRTGSACSCRVRRCRARIAAENAVLGTRRAYVPHAVATGSFTGIPSTAPWG